MFASYRQTEDIAKNNKLLFTLGTYTTIFANKADMHAQLAQTKMYVLETQRSCMMRTSMYILKISYFRSSN